jgi:hypothetical protein
VIGNYSSAFSIATASNAIAIQFLWLKKVRSSPIALSATRQQAELIHPAATGQDRTRRITFKRSVDLNNSAPYARIIHLDRLTVSQIRDGIAVVPSQWERRLNLQQKAEETLI